MNWSDLGGTPTYSHLQVAGITILFYDYLLTFSAEVSYIWPQPLSLNTSLFYLNRYISFVGNIATPILLFSDIGYSAESCTYVTFFRQALLVLNQVVVAAILSTRTIALYNSSRAIIFSVLGFGLVLAGVTCWTLVGQHVKNDFIRGIAGCNYSLSENAAIRLAAAWEASALFDAFIFVLTLMRTLKIRKTHHTLAASVGLVDVLIRDGALYFAVMVLTNFANIFTFYFAQPPSRGIFTTPVSCISASLCSRLVLNLYEFDDANSGSSPEPTTTAVLTTRIELDIPVDDDHAA